MGERYDRHFLYERCVQAPELLVPLLRRLHGGAPRVLGEDFCGTAALAREWLRSDPQAHAIAVDHDAEALAGARGTPRLELVHADVRAVDVRCDVLFVGNFSIGELGSRDELLSYLRHARARLAPGGVLVCDTYGGAGAWRTGAVERRHWIAPGVCVRYLWEQRTADPLTARVENALSFRVEEAGEIVAELTDAFVYRWRLWSVPELADALRESGFVRPSVVTELDGSARAPSREPDRCTDEIRIACLCARVDSTPAAASR